MRRALLGFLVFAGAAHAEPPLLLQRPAVSAKQVAFCYAGDLWVVGRSGGDDRPDTVRQSGRGPLVGQRTGGG